MTYGFRKRTKREVLAYKRVHKETLNTVLDEQNNIECEMHKRSAKFSKT